jgi:hypothetical protein
MSLSEEIESFERESLLRDSVVQEAPNPYSRAMGSPLSMGSTSRQAPSPPYESNGNGHGNGSGVRSESNGTRPAPSPAHASVPPGHALTTPKHSEEQSGFQRALSVLRTAIPLVQRILPLLDGNIGTAVSNFLTPPPPPPAPPPPAPKVDLAPIEKSLSDLQTLHRDLRGQVTEQNHSLKRVEDQLEMVREATDRNTLEQQELLEDLKSFSSKVKIGAFVAFGLLTLSVVLNVILYLHIKTVLP